MQSDGTTQHGRGESKASAPVDIRLLLGTGTTGTPISWKCQPKPGRLSIQGPANAGKTTLLKNLASQASAHLDVYAFISEATDRAPAFKAYASDPRDAGELLLEVRAATRSALKQVQDYQDSFLTEKQRNSKTAMNLLALGRNPPPIWRPMSAVLFIDDIDSLYRYSTSPNEHSDYPGGSYTIVDELARQGDRAGLSAVVAGRSLSRSPLTGLRGHSSRLLLGPSTLAEREAFLYTDVALLEAGEGAGLFEDTGMKVAEMVSIASNPHETS